ncbi:sensor domain-containing diguanylate cyclase [Acidithiobacillus sp.]|uniref:sensor domain-containing diguanylate cyclase n=1 Tax=Acidithiobacillus sp. TaxID=1872118 RepID=UPI0025BB6444|nr:sensor domain-containing diguanylate cyclase [Acidithiobacillus sp.]
MSDLRAWLEVFSCVSRIPFAEMERVDESTDEDFLGRMADCLEGSPLLHSVAIGRADADGVLRPVAAAGPFRAQILGDVRVFFAPDHPHARSVSVRALREDRTLVVSDYLHSEYLQHPSLAGWRETLAKIGIRWLAAAPIGGQKTPWGVLVLAGTGKLPPAELELASTILARFIADSLRLREAQRRTLGLHRQLQQVAERDPLTDLPNRRALQRALALPRALDGAGRTAVVMLDLDDFKVVNDELSHQAGDLVLLTLAERLRASLRRGDFVARYGGDEFVLILQGCAERNAAEEVLARLEQALLQPLSVAGREWTLKASMGVALAVDHPAQDAERLLRLADLALYRAKALKGQRSRSWCFANAEDSPRQGAALCSSSPAEIDDDTRP